MILELSRCFQRLRSEPQARERFYTIARGSGFIPVLPHSDSQSGNLLFSSIHPFFRLLLLLLLLRLFLFDSADSSINLVRFFSFLRLILLPGSSDSAVPCRGPLGRFQQSFPLPLLLRLLQLLRHLQLLQVSVSSVDQWFTLRVYLAMVNITDMTSRLALRVALREGLVNMLRPGHY